MNVMVYGSNKVSFLTDLVRNQLESYISVNATILVGDANGTDAEVQRYLMKRGYRNVKVFFSSNGASITQCLNNYGKWEQVRCLDWLLSKTKDLHDYKYLSMLKQCDDVFVITWNNEIEYDFMKNVERNKSPNNIHIFNIIDSSEEEFQMRQSYYAMHREYVENCKMARKSRYLRRSRFVRRLLRKYIYSLF